MKYFIQTITIIIGITFIAYGQESEIPKKVILVAYPNLQGEEVPNTGPGLKVLRIEKHGQRLIGDLLKERGFAVKDLDKEADTGDLHRKFGRSRKTKDIDYFLEAYVEYIDGDSKEDKVKIDFRITGKDNFEVENKKPHYFTEEKLLDDTKIKSALKLVMDEIDILSGNPVNSDDFVPNDNDTIPDIDVMQPCTRIFKTFKKIKESPITWLGISGIGTGTILYFNSNANYNRYKEDWRQQQLSLGRNHPRYAKDLKKARNKKTWGYITGISGVVVVGVSLFDWECIKKKNKDGTESNKNKMDIMPYVESPPLLGHPVSGLKITHTF